MAENKFGLHKSLSFVPYFLEAKISNRISITNYSFRYEGTTLLWFFHEKHGKFAHGYTGTKLMRNDITIRYKLLNLLNRLDISGITGASMLKSETTGNSLNNTITSISFDGIEVFKEVEVKSENFSNSQVIPLLGAEMSYKVWKFDLFANIVGMKGFITHQRMITKYQYYGEIRPKVITENRGTGFAVNFGLRTNFLQPDFENKTTRGE